MIFGPGLADGRITIEWNPMERRGDSFNCTGGRERAAGIGRPLQRNGLRAATSTRARPPLLARRRRRRLGDVT